MARRRRTGTVGFDQKIVQDVGIAALAVRILPMVINNFFPINQTLYTVAGVGGGYLTGTLLKNKTLANASIGIGLVEFIAPAIENLISSFGGSLYNSGGMNPPLIPMVSRSLPPVKQRQQPEWKMRQLDDYINLNDYTDNPSQRLDVREYKDYY